MNTGRKIIASVMVVICLSVFWQIKLVSAWGPSHSELSKITVHQFHDTNRNGRQDEGEAYLENQLVRLYIEKGGSLQQIAESTTGNSGALVDLPSSPYKIWTELAECWLPTTAGRYWRGGYLIAASLSAGQQLTVGLGQTFTCAGSPSLARTTDTLLPQAAQDQTIKVAEKHAPISVGVILYQLPPTNTPPIPPTDTPPIPTDTATPTPTNTPPIPTYTPTPTSTNTPTDTATPTPTNTPPNTPTYTPTPTSTNTPTDTATPTNTSIPTNMPTSTITPTPLPGCVPSGGQPKKCNATPMPKPTKPPKR